MPSLAALQASFPDAARAALNAAIRTMKSEGRSVVARQPEAGSQKLLEQLLPGSGIDAGQISFADVARTESDAAIAVAERRADAADALGVDG